MGSGASSVPMSESEYDHLSYLRDIEEMQRVHALQQGLQSHINLGGVADLTDDEFLLQQQMHGKDYANFKEKYMSTLIKGGGEFSNSDNLLDNDYNYADGFSVPHFPSATVGKFCASSGEYEDSDREFTESLVADWFSAVIGCSVRASRENAARCISAGVASVESLLSQVKQSLTIDRNRNVSALLDLLVLDNYQKQLVISNCRAQQGAVNSRNNLSNYINKRDKNDSNDSHDNRQPYSYNMETAMEMMSMLDSAYRASQALNMTNSLNIPIPSSVQRSTDSEHSIHGSSGRYNNSGSLLESAGGLEEDIDYLSKIEEEVYAPMAGRRLARVVALTSSDEVVSRWLEPLSAPVLHFSDDRASVWRNGSVGYFPKALTLVSALVTMMSVRMDRAPMRNNYFSFGASSLVALESDNGSGLFGDKLGSWGLISRRNDPSQRLEMWAEGTKKCVLEDTLREGDMLSILFDLTSSSCTFFLNDQMIYIFEDLSICRSLQSIDLGGQVALGSVVCDDHCVSIMPDFCKEHFSHYFNAIDSSHKNLASITRPAIPSRIQNGASVDVLDPTPSPQRTSFSVSSNNRHNRERLDRTLELIDNVNDFENIDSFYDELGVQLSNPAVGVGGGSSETAATSSDRIRSLIRAAPDVSSSNNNSSDTSRVSVRATPVPANFPRSGQLLVIPGTRVPTTTTTTTTTTANLVKNASGISSVTVASNKEADKTSDSSGANSSCVICWEFDKCVVLFPCRHMCLCEKCGLQDELLVTQCPMCRQPIEQRFKVFT